MGPTVEEAPTLRRSTRQRKQRDSVAQENESATKRKRGSSKKPLKEQLPNSPFAEGCATADKKKRRVRRQSMMNTLFPGDPVARTAAGCEEDEAPCDTDGSADEHAVVCEELKATKEALREAEAAKAALESRLAEMESNSSRGDDHSGNADLQARLTLAEQELVHRGNIYKAQEEAWRDERASLRSTLQEQTSLCASVQAQKAARGAMEARVGQLERQCASLRKKLAECSEELRQQREARSSEHAALTCRMEHAEQELAAAVAGHQNASASLARAEAVRRELHEQVMSLRGNIRVFCRVRPTDAITESAFSFPDGAAGGTHRSLVLTALPPPRSVDGCSEPVSKRWRFEFDRVFGPETKQAELFGEVSGLVQSAIDGYNVCIFAYGQTGSGKTHTLFGPPPSVADTGAMDEEGVVPRAVRRLFAAARETEAAGAATDGAVSFSFGASFVEIYNEQIRDLLVAPSASSSAGRAGAAPPSWLSSTGSAEPVQIRHEPGGTGASGGKGSTTLHGANVVTLPTHGNEGATRVAQLLEHATRVRATARTKMNARSSRSHSIFTLHIEPVTCYPALCGGGGGGVFVCHWPWRAVLPSIYAFLGRMRGGEGGEVRRSALHLVDLAGSERLSQSGSGASSTVDCVLLATGLCASVEYI